MSIYTSICKFSIPFHAYLFSSSPGGQTQGVGLMKVYLWNEQDSNLAHLITINSYFFFFPRSIQVVEWNSFFKIWLLQLLMVLGASCIYAPRSIHTISFNISNLKTGCIFFFYLKELITSRIDRFYIGKNHCMQSFYH